MLTRDQMDVPRVPVFDACGIIVDHADSTRALNYAVNYAQQCRNMLRNDEPDNAITIQCRYILANIGSWRGETARNVREALKAWVIAR